MTPQLDIDTSETTTRIAPKLLIVDDEPRNVKILQKLFQNQYTLLASENGADALQVFTREYPAVVLLDIMMPGMNGYEVCRKIRELSTYKIEKIILLSGKSTTEEKIEGYEAGADDYVTKPFVHEEIQAKVRAFSRLYQFERQLLISKRHLEEEVEHKNLKLMDQEKLVYLGMHSAELVHNLKNPLAVLSSYISFMEEGLFQKDFTERMRNATNRLLTIVSSILTSTKASVEHDSVDFDLNQLIRNEVEMIRINNQVKHSTQFELNLGDIPPVHGVPAHFSQILVNLLSNAVEAMDKSPQKILTVSTDVSDQRIRVNVRDTGPGIPQEFQERIFDPMFSTKRSSPDSPTSGGTGLGLAAAKKMVDCYAGSIYVRESSPRGTVMTFEIPLSA